MPIYVYRWIAVALSATAVLIGVSQYNTSTAAPGNTRAAGSSHRVAPTQSQQSDSEENSAKRRLREGTQITDVVGHFRQDGDGATFVSDEGQEFGGLSNLNLERVVRSLKGADETKRVHWSVSGQVTEFMGRNFLLISRAVYKSAAQPPVPERFVN